MLSDTRDASFRMRNFKNKGKDSDELRRRRQESNVELRKARKDDQMLKRRNICVGELAAGAVAGGEMSEMMASPEQPQQMAGVSAAPPANAPVLSIEEIVQGVYSGSLAQQLIAVQAARKILSRERNPPIDLIIQSNLVPHFVTFLSCHQNALLQFESAWALTNIASGTSLQTQQVVTAGAVEPLISLLSSPHANIAEQAVWALGNIAGDGPELRDFTIRCGLVEPLLDLVRPDLPVHFLRNVTWTLSNLCRNKNPPPPQQTVERVLPAIAFLVQHQDAEVVADACWAVSYLTDGDNSKIERVICTPGIVQRLVMLLGHKEGSVVSPTIRSLGNIVTGSDQQTDVVVKQGALAYFPGLFKHVKPNIAKEACWTISNIAAGNHEQIQAIIDAGLLPLVIEVLKTGELKTQREAVWVVQNFTSGGLSGQIAEIYKLDVIPSLCSLLTIDDVKLLSVTLDSLSNIFKYASSINDLENATMQVEHCGGVDTIEALQYNRNESIYTKVVRLLTDYFEGDDTFQEDPEMVGTEGPDYVEDDEVDEDTGSSMMQQPGSSHTGYNF